MPDALSLREKLMRARMLASMAAEAAKDNAPTMLYQMGRASAFDALLAIQLHHSFEGPFWAGFLSVMMTKPGESVG